MAVSADSIPSTHRSTVLDNGSEVRPEQPAAAAAARVARAGALLGALGLASSAFVVARLVESWRVTPQTTSHHISLLGQRVSYPAANVAAVVVLVLALMGLAVTALAIAGAVREYVAARRFARALDSSEMQLLDDAVILAEDRPIAFCAGLLRPRVYVSSGAVALLDEQALRAVIAHERHHARRRDPLRLAAGRVMARALFFIPGLKGLVRRQQALSELSADEDAIGARDRNRSALARAMLAFSDVQSSDHRIGVEDARVDYLLGEPPSWRFPLVLSLAALSMIALVVAVGVLAGQVADGSATLAPPFLSRQPCVAVLALIPALLGLLALWLRRNVFGDRGV